MIIKNKNKKIKVSQNIYKLLHSNSDMGYWNLKKIHNFFNLNHKIKEARSPIKVKLTPHLR